MLGRIKSAGPEARTPRARDGRNLDHVLRSEDMAYVLCDADGRVQQAGGNIAGLTGYDDTEAPIGETLDTVLQTLELCNPDGSGAIDFNDVPRLIRAVMDAGEERRIPTLAYTPDGRVLCVNTFFPGDRTVVATLRDVSDIAADRMLLDAAVRGANAGYWTLDFQSREYSYSDSVSARLTERERDAMQRNGLFAIVHPDDLARITAQWQDILSGVAPFDLSYRVQTEADGVMWQRSLGQLQRRADGRLTKAVAFVMDITADMEARAELEEVQGMATAKEDFLARMSHEIRTPLNAIIGMADSLSDEPMSDAVREVVADMEAAAESLTDMLSRTLEHAKLDTGSVRAELEDTDPRDVLQACAQMWRAKAQAKGLGFALHVADDVPTRIALDPFRLRQCLNNLIGNAVKFTDAGRVTVAARTVQRGGQPQLALIVQDTGIGISEAEQRTVFDAYRQADGSISRRFGGTGLGLSICRQLSELMGGDIKLRSTPGEGSAFLLFLPMTQSAARPGSGASERSTPDKAADTAVSAAKTAPSARALSPKAAPPASARVSQGAAQAPDEPGRRLPFEGLSVLCVEDNPVNQKVVERLIGNRVQQLHFASHGREALSVLATVQVDVVLMDIHMPVMDGIETTMEIRKSDAPYANVIIIALTADPDYQQMRICRNIGMDDTIAKPVRREDILEAFGRSVGKMGDTYGVRVALA